MPVRCGDAVGAGPAAGERKRDTTGSRAAETTARPNPSGNGTICSWVFAASASASSSGGAMLPGWLATANVHGGAVCKLISMAWDASCFRGAGTGSISLALASSWSGPHCIATPYRQPGAVFNPSSIDCDAICVAGLAVALRSSKASVDCRPPVFACAAAPTPSKIGYCLTGAKAMADSAAGIARFIHGAPLLAFHSMGCTKPFRSPGCAFPAAPARAANALGALLTASGSSRVTATTAGVSKVASKRVFRAFPVASIGSGPLRAQRR